MHISEKKYNELLWGSKTWEEIRACSKKGFIPVLPLGSIEQHGPMLPVECDWFLAHSWCLEGAYKASAKGVKVLVLPAIPYGVSIEHIDFSGTLTLHCDTYIRMIQDISRNIIRAGFNKLVYVSGHGGNMVPLQTAVRELKLELKEKGQKKIQLYIADDKNCFNENEKIYNVINQKQFDFHASAVETSYYLFMKPELVRKNKMTRPKVKCSRTPAYAWFTKKDITESGASGDPSVATKDWGAKIFEYKSLKLAEFLNNIFKNKI